MGEVCGLIPKAWVVFGANYKVCIAKSSLHELAQESKESYGSLVQRKLQTISSSYLRVNTSYVLWCVASLALVSKIFSLTYQKRKRVDTSWGVFPKSCVLCAIISCIL